MDTQLKEWETCNEQISLVDEEIIQRASRSVPDSALNPTQILMTAPGAGCYSGLTLASRIGPIERFPRPPSLANYFGLTPGCRNSGQKQAGFRSHISASRTRVPRVSREKQGIKTLFSRITGTAKVPANGFDGFGQHVKTPHLRWEIIVWRIPVQLREPP